MWDRIQRIEAVHPNGTVCLSTKSNTAQIVSRCRAWTATRTVASDAASMANWLASFAGSSTSTAIRGRRIDVTNCDELEKAIDAGCSFDPAPVDQFSVDMQKNGGDFTIAFWVRPIGAMSMNENPASGKDRNGDARFYPHLSFMASTSPPQHNLQWGLWSNSNGEVRVHSSCRRLPLDIYENIEVRATSGSDWTFMAISRKNTSTSANPPMTWTATNEMKNWKATDLAACLFNPQSFFSSIEINYPMLLSPIMMIPTAIDFALAQQLYLSSKNNMDLRHGPRLTRRDMLQEQLLPLYKADFLPRSVLIAPPIIFQTRVKHSSSCPYAYSSIFIQQQHTRVLSAKCAHPYQFPEPVLTRPENTVSCPGPREVNDTWFGILPSDFGGRRGYADMLFSLSDNPFLFRDDQVKATRDFLDSSTESASIILLFFTPSLGMTSVLRVNCDFIGNAAGSIEFELDHYEMLEGRALTNVLVCQILVLFNVVFILFDSVLVLRGLWKNAHEQQQSIFTNVSALVKLSIDFVLSIAVLVFVSMRIPSKTSSSHNTVRLVGEISNITWRSPETTLQQKTSVLIASLTQFMKLINEETKLNGFCSIILICSLFRVIQCTAVHQRLALFTGTITRAADHLLHALYLILLFIFFFAAFAYWRFGAYRKDFSTFQNCVMYNFMMFFGKFPEDWAGLDQPTRMTVSSSS